mmetsp:Transcript_31835/g.66919  ORF Transcript_31835/g.66919 Transcript_31835/m.66919 type:complete len:211 (+) Transcript_31835:472-1104(+)
MVSITSNCSSKIPNTIGKHYKVYATTSLIPSGQQKGALLLTTWLFVIGGLIQSLAPSTFVTVVARLVIGVASGAATIFWFPFISITLSHVLHSGPYLPIYVACDWYHDTELSLVIWILFADMIVFPLANATQWRYMFSLTLALALLPLGLKPFLLESPRRLLGRNPNSAEARFIIKKPRGFRYDEEVFCSCCVFVFLQSLFLCSMTKKLK